MVIETLTTNKKQDKNKTIRDWIFIIGIIFGGLIGILIRQWIHTNEVHDQLRKAGTVKWKECEKRCASFGISQDSLIGPTLERDIHSKSTFNYLFVWHADNPSVTLKINVIKSRDYTVKISWEWIVNGKSVDNQTNVE